MYAEKKNDQHYPLFVCFNALLDAFLFTCADFLRRVVRKAQAPQTTRGAKVHSQAQVHPCLHRQPNDGIDS
jgi:hypothetical protein